MVKKKSVTAALAATSAMMLLLAGPSATAQSGASNVMVLEGGTLIDGTGAAPLADPVIVVEGGRIKAVGKRGTVKIPAGAKIIKTDGRTILPGLIDAHVHMQDWQLGMFLHYGVTTIADLASDLPWILSQRELTQRPGANYPRMFVAGTPMQGPLSHQALGTFDQPDTQNVEESKAYLHKMIDAGVDILKVNNNITDDQLAAAIQVAKETGFAVIGHTRNSRKAASLGYKFAEHSFTIGNALRDPENTNQPMPGRNSLELPDPAQFPPLVDYLVKDGMYMNLTMANTWAPCTPRGQEMIADAVEVAKNPALTFVPAAKKAGWTKIADCQELSKLYPNVKEWLRQYAAAGGQSIIGTDTGDVQGRGPLIPGLAVIYEMEALYNVGYSRMQVIQAATMWNAQMMHKDKDLGTVEAGKLADFDIIDGDPLADLGALKHVHMVIKAGRVMDTKYDPKWTNPVPQPFSVFQLPVPPQVSGLRPAALPQGSKTMVLQVEGTMFSPGAVVRLDNDDLPTQFVSPTQLTATLDAKELEKSPGSYVLYVVDTGIHGTLTAPAYFKVLPRDQSPPLDNTYKAAKPVVPGVTGQSPRFNGLLPGAARIGDPTVTIQIDGSKFAPNAVVHFDNAQLPTTFISPTKLTATLDAKLLRRHAASYVLYVVNPGPHGSDTDVQGTVSEAGYFLVNLKK